MNKFSVMPLLCALSAPVWAQDQPQGPVILKVTGNVTSADIVDGQKRFDLAMLQALPQREIVSGNPWVDKPHTYKGPRIADVLQSVGADGKSLTLTAVNDYQVKMNWDKVKQYDPIIAWQDNGVTMKLRDKGPLWVILPLDQYPELKKSEFTDLMIWQLGSIDIQH